MVVDGYIWTRVPGPAIEVRALTDKATGTALPVLGAPRSIEVLDYP
jgi:hypothetical protein